MQSFPSCRLWVVEQIHQTEMRIVLNHATGRSEGETNPAGRIHPATPSHPLVDQVKIYFSPCLTWGEPSEIISCGICPNSSKWWPNEVESVSLFRTRTGVTPLLWRWPCRIVPYPDWSSYELPTHTDKNCGKTYITENWMSATQGKTSRIKKNTRGSLLLFSPSHYHHRSKAKVFVG